MKRNPFKKFATRCKKDGNYYNNQHYVTRLNDIYYIYTGYYGISVSYRVYEIYFPELGYPILSNNQHAVIDKKEGVKISDYIEPRYNCVDRLLNPEQYAVGWETGIYLKDNDGREKSCIADGEKITTVNRAFLEAMQAIEKYTSIKTGEKSINPITVTGNMFSGMICPISYGKDDPIIKAIQEAACYV